MKFDDLDKKMRVYEQSLDQVIIPDIYLIARLDGRSFTRLTKEICQFEAPFDIEFRDMMVNTVKSLMNFSFSTELISMSCRHGRSAVSVSGGKMSKKRPLTPSPMKM